jgi:hypothetical protein
VVRDGYEAMNDEGPDAARRYMDPDIEAPLWVWHAYLDEFEGFRWGVERLFGGDDRAFLRVRERGRSR